MATASLSASLRSDTGKGAARTLRRDGQIPAIIYGHNREPQPLAVSARDLDKLLAHISAENTIIELGMDGTSARALIREIQRHPFKRQVLHVDFQEVVAGEKMTVRVPVTLVGTPVGVRLNGGIIDHTMRELTLLVDPANIPNHIEIDITNLDLGGSVHVSDIKAPEGCIITDEPGAAVVVMSTPRAAVEAAASEEGAAEPEVLKAKKPDDSAA